MTFFIEIRYYFRAHQLYKNSIIKNYIFLGQCCKRYSLVDCLTCGPGPGLPAPCGHAAAEVSPDCSAYVLRCGGPGVPYTATLALPANQVRCIELETKAMRRFAKI